MHLNKLIITLLARNNGGEAWPARRSWHILKRLNIPIKASAAILRFVIGEKSGGVSRAIAREHYNNQIPVAACVKET